MTVIKPPQPIPAGATNILFLAGSIEMGKAEPWQERVEELLKDTDWVILNPRRDNWDSSWVQSIDNPQFKEQVIWELQGLERASKVIFYFDPNTKSPISMLELGLFAKSPEKAVVVCPQGFWRKGNVDIVCERYGILQVNSLEEAVEHLKVKTI